jgi:glycosyltransferase involved in cell wall biosynthesis
MIITTSPKGRFNGNWRHLKELELSTGLTKHIDTEELLAKSLDDIDFIIMGGGFCDSYDQLNDFALKKGIKTSILHCSPFGQSAINNETRFLNFNKSLLESGSLSVVFTGDQAMADAMGPKWHWLPQTMDTAEISKIPLTQNKDFVGMFNSSGLNKNPLNQMVAVKLAKKFLVTNGFDSGSEFIHFANKISLPYTNYGWLKLEEYHRVLAQCQIGLQCSWSESFDYVAAEMSAMGIPVITGPTIYWNHPSLIVKNIDDPFEIALKLVDEPPSPKIIKETIKKELDYHKTEATKILKKIMKC